MSVYNEAGDFVLVHNILWNLCDGNAHVFAVVKSSVEIEIFEIGSKTLSSWCGNNAVEDNFDCGEVGCFRAGVAIVSKEVAADGEADAFAFGFVWCVSGDNAQIRDRFSVWDCTFLNKSDGFRASGNFGVNASC